jgi:hypothetical protein
MYTIAAPQPAGLDSNLSVPSSGYSLSCHLILTEKYEEYKSFSKFQMTVDLCLKTKEDKTHCMTK